VPLLNWTVVAFVVLLLILNSWLASKDHEHVLHAYALSGYHTPWLHNTMCLLLLLLQTGMVAWCW
jgi:hypothetical protein